MNYLKYLFYRIVHYMALEVNVLAHRLLTRTMVEWETQIHIIDLVILENNSNNIMIIMEIMMILFRQVLSHLITIHHYQVLNGIDFGLFQNKLNIRICF
jgi:hypothetical protein